MNASLTNPRPSRLKRFRAWLFSWHIIRRTLVALAVCATLTAIFYTVENWRGQRAWEQCKRDLIAAGYELDWNKLIPPSIPDEQNIFKAPHMQEWFVRQPSITPDGIPLRTSGSNFLHALQDHPSFPHSRKKNPITDATAARDYLSWTEQFTSEFTSIQTALNRPHARMDGDYTEPFEIPIPNFVALRFLAQTLGQRAHGHLLLNQPDEALADLTFIHATRKLLLNEPTGKPMTLVAAMIHVAITGIYTERIAAGLENHSWQEKHLSAFESQLAELNLPALTYEGMRCEMIATTYAFQNAFHNDSSLKLSLLVTKAPPKPSWKDWLKDLPLRAYGLVPRGWRYQNLVVHASLERMILESIQGFETNTQPKRISAANAELQANFERSSLFNMVAKVAIPNFSKAVQTTIKNQTSVNQARIACALERYRLSHGQFPDSLAALQPKFLAVIPHDLIGSLPLKYRRTEAGSFVLYSVGWNELDEGGTATSDVEKGDWVWRYPQP
jgi:hypothetical protein